MIDFLIIGGGIGGISTAARLAPLGKTVVLERESALGYHASGRSAAMFEPNYGAPSTVELSHASGELFKQEDGGFLSPRGVMFLAAKGEDEAFKRSCESFDAAPMELQQAVDMVPILNVDAIGNIAHHHSGEDIDTDRLIQWFAKSCRAYGGDVHTGQEVTKITKQSNGWEVVANGEAYTAKMLLNAAGAWVDEIAILAGIPPLNVNPLRRSMARIPAPGGHDVSQWPMLLDIHENWYAKPDAGSLIVSPAEEDPMQPFDAWPDDMVIAEGLARYQEFVTEEVTRVEAIWAGLRTFSPDRNLVIGPDAADPSFFWVACQGGYGFQSCPAASQLVADMIAGQAPTIDRKVIQALDPARYA
ncbi:NAD(P)/FAD-dependent oxidoreductase [Shimia sagamensis]|uniref:Glycine/D-amino acid oxidase n=1 Tax=Shimia sagamensis TaxID=1566352 RepID=A0ABY1NUE8_9RHOB|nr:FAD-dependent oxidoreductase [Shimia sagamensis]SMP18329.1 Glycine/D-amino acid oxidase [Shimia sagamensis]